MEQFDCYWFNLWVRGHIVGVWILGTPKRRYGHDATVYAQAAYCLVELRHIFLHQRQHVGYELLYVHLLPSRSRKVADSQWCQPVAIRT